MNSFFKKSITKNDHYLGNTDSPLLLIEYADFECPYSGVAASVLKELFSEFEFEMCFMFRHFPLNGIHPEAEIAALASESAANQDMFWEMHELLFEHQEHLSRDMIVMLARKLKLNMDQFLLDLQKQETIDKVRLHQSLALENGVESTPTIFLNEKKYEGPTSYWPLREEIERQVGRNQLSSNMN